MTDNDDAFSVDETIRKDARLAHAPMRNSRTSWRCAEDLPIAGATRLGIVALVISLPPHLTAPAELNDTLALRGFAVVGRDAIAGLADVDTGALLALSPSWNDLPEDVHLKDDGRYRRRRHGSFIVQSTEGVVDDVPHRPHYQGEEYNALHGGLLRLFSPLSESFSAAPAFRRVLVALGHIARERFFEDRFFVEVHQVRIDASSGIGRPTPEGAHRDGVDLVAVMLIDRQGVKGGETRVFDADGRAGERFTLMEPWSALLLDDAAVIHESTPIQPSADANAEPSAEAGPAHRDTLVVTLRRGSFQDPPGR
jgi:hypothetical protein